MIKTKVLSTKDQDSTMVLIDQIFQNFCSMINIEFSKSQQRFLS